MDKINAYDTKNIFSPLTPPLRLSRPSGLADYAGLPLSGRTMAALSKSAGNFKKP